MTKPIIINAHYQRAHDLAQVAAALGWVGLSLVALAVMSFLVLGSIWVACIAGALSWGVAYARNIYEQRAEQELVLMWAEEKGRPS